MPGQVFSDSRAWAHPIWFALLHAGAVLATCAVQLAYWRFIHQAQAESAAQLSRSEERYRALVQDSGDVISVVNADGVIDSVSPAALTVMGYRPEKLVGTDYYQLIHPDDVTAVRASRGGATEVRTRHADGTWHWHDVTVRDLTANPAVGGLVISHRDVTERREFQKRLRHEGEQDVLTGVLSRDAFLEEFGARDGRLAVLLINLNDFKAVNDTYGHKVGDKLLVAVSHTLRRSVLGADTVGRLGGDEFAVVLTDIGSPDNAVAVANRIQHALFAPVTVGGVTLRSTAGIGIAFNDGGRVATAELLQHADAAVSEAKQAKATGVGWALGNLTGTGQDGPGGCACRQMGPTWAGRCASCAAGMPAAAASGH